MTLREEFEPVGICHNGLAGFRQSRAQCWDQTVAQEGWEDGLRGEIERATAFLEQCGRRKTLNRTCTSYGLKHEAERWAANNGWRERGGYVSNGALLMAAHRMGFQIKRCGEAWQGSPNAWLNISQDRPGHDQMLRMRVALWHEARVRRMF